jgi:hypothetical protein
VKQLSVKLSASTKDVADHLLAEVQVATAHLDLKDRRDRKVNQVQMANKALRANPVKWDQKVLLDLRANKAFRASKASKAFRAKQVLKASRVR